MEQQMFEVGRSYKRKPEIHKVFGGQEQNGISTPKGSPMIFIFSGANGTQYGYHDRWIDGEIFEFYGEGLTGDMTFTGGNAAVRDHLSNGRSIHLFEKQKDGRQRYAGEMVLAAHRFG